MRPYRTMTIALASTVYVLDACGGGEAFETQPVDRAALSITVCKGRSTLGRICNDGDPCTFDDRCTLTGCAGTPYSCDDGLFCTADACDGSGGCTHTPIPNVCDDGNPCTADSCDLTAGCLHAPLTDGSPCSDLDPCTFGDVCAAGVCTATRYSCDDGDPTTLDSCVGDGTCDNTAVIGICPDPVLDCNMNPCAAGTICDSFTACCVSSCPDGYRNSDESDVDCGGSCPIKCADGKSCWGDRDCQSKHCLYDGSSMGTCVP